MQNRERVERILRTAVGRWTEIFVAAGMPEEHFRRPNRPCPLCGGRDRFTLFRKDEQDRGGWFCRGCGAGDGLGLLQRFRHATFPETLEWLEAFLGLPPWRARGERAVSERTPKRRADERRRAALERRWIEAMTVDLRSDSPASRYLLARGIRHLDGTTELRWVPDEPYWEEGEKSPAGYWPALLARVSDASGMLVALHRTYLTEAGEKAPVANVKKLSAGSLGEGFVRLYPPGRVLCLAEGIETALSVHELTGLPVWSVISVGGFRRFECAPEGVGEIRIYADNDRSFAGVAGAFELAARLRRGDPDLLVTVLTPEAEGEDWNDVLLRRSR